MVDAAGSPAPLGKSPTMAAPEREARARTTEEEAKAWKAT